MNILTKHTWEMMGRPQLVWSHVQLHLENQAKVSPIGRVPRLPVKVEGLKAYADFDAIEIVDNIRMYPTLLGISYAIENLMLINFKKRIMTFDNHDTRVTYPLDPLEGQ